MRDESVETYYPGDRQSTSGIYSFCINPERGNEKRKAAFNSAHQMKLMPINH